MVGEVVAHEAGNVSLPEIGVVQFAVRSVDIALVGMGAGEGVLQSVDIAANGHTFGEAAGSSVEAQPCFALDGLLAALLGDDVDHAADGVGAVEHGGRALDDFDALNAGGIDKKRRAGHGLVFRNFLAVDEYEGSEGVFTTNGHALQALRAVVLYLNTGHVLQKFAHGASTGLLHVFGGHHGQAHGHLLEFALHTSGGNVHVTGFYGFGGTGIRRGEESTGEQEGGKAFPCQFLHHIHIPFVFPPSGWLWFAGECAPPPSPASVRPHLLNYRAASR